MINQFIKDNNYIEEEWLLFTFEPSRFIISGKRWSTYYYKDESENLMNNIDDVKELIKYLKDIAKYDFRINLNNYIKTIDTQDEDIRKIVKYIEFGYFVKEKCITYSKRIRTDIKQNTDQFPNYFEDFIYID